MTYLSRLLLNPHDPKVQRDLGNCQDLHRTILRAFPDIAEKDAARAAHGVLFRVEEDRSSALPRLLVQSEEAPNWDELLAGYLAHTEGAPVNPATRRTDDLYATLTPGRVFRFRLRANPTKRLLHDADAERQRRNGRRVDLRREDDQIAWLIRKGNVGGFDLVYVETNPGVPDVLTMHGPRQYGRRRSTGSLTFGSVLFEGELRVTDATVFRNTLQHGIGSGKAYGFGLLSLAPVRPAS